MAAMLENGVDVNSVDRYGNTAVHYNYEHAEMLAWLIAHGANLDAQNKEGWTALHLACDDYADKTNAALNLIENGADPNVQGCRGRTPLILACSKHNPSTNTNRLRIVQMLLANQADPNLEWEEGTALHAAILRAWAEEDPSAPAVLEALVEGGANVNARAANDGNTPLQRLVFFDGHGYDAEKGVEVLKFMARYKADTISPCGNGVPPRRAAKSIPFRNYFNNAGK
eukprot:TRINITY_DN661_c0_g1_i1.p1 TRINITY_DN661_c0_g1~~TRINITY_DN661_c0_g1_i1.p1  ORF type:complete len:227 (-),score=56.51 TRINITY_DN661_c0_g1_i1:294-974(-)